MNVLGRPAKPLLSFLCQSLVSGVSFVVSLALLRYGQHEDYASYVLVINTYMLLFSLMNALLLQPMVTLSSRMSSRAIRQTLLVASVGGLALGMLGSACLIGYQMGLNTPSSLTLPGLILPLCFCLLLFRDVQRAGWLLDGNLPSLLKLDVSYFVLALLALTPAAVTGKLGLEHVLLAMAVPALVGLLYRVRVAPREGELPVSTLDRAFWREVWGCASWALPGVLVTWLFSNGYWFYLAHQEGQLAVAMLAASRLAFTPIGLMIQSWSAVFRPHFARLAYRGALDEIADASRRHRVIAIGAVLGYAMLLSLVGEGAPQWLPSYLAGNTWHYYVWAWAGYFTVQWLRTMRMTACLAHTSGFRLTFQASVLGCGVFYLLLLSSSWWAKSPLWCPLSLIVAEVVIYLSLREKNHALMAKPL